MNASFDKTASNKLQIGSTHTVLECLDALSSGACDPETFLNIVIDLMKRAPDTSWEVLSLLDQNYRRGKIKPELFQRLKARLQSVALGNGNEPQVPGTRAPAAPPEPTNVTAPISATEPEPRRARPEPPREGQAQPQPQAYIAEPAPPVERPAHLATDRTAARGRESAQSRKRFYMGDLLRGRYRLSRVISQGAGASLFETSDEFFMDLPDPGRKVALKMLSNSVTSDLDVYANVRREFQRLQSLSHPSILRVHEFDRDGDSAFFTMELLTGASLRRIMRAREQVPLAKMHALSITRAVGDVLIFALANGVSHGLISLRNIFITDDGELRLLDFGTAETLDGQNPNLLDDPYALACVAYTLLAGKHPYQNRPAVEARADGLEPVRPAGLSARQWRALKAGLSLERSARPSSVAEWLYRLDPRRAVERLPTLTDLERGATSAPLRERGPSWVLGTAVGVVVLIGAAAVLYPGPAQDALHGTTSTLSSAVNGVSTFLSEKLASTHATPATPAPVAVAPDEPPAAELPSARPPVAALPPAAATPPLPAQPAAPVPTPATPPPVAHTAPPDTTPPVAAATPAAAVPSPATAPQPTTARIEFAADSTEVSSVDESARIVVRRRGNLRNEASFSWWTESATAKAGVDFTAVAKQTAQFEPGKDKVILIVPLVANPARNAPKNFYVVIDEPGPGAALANRTLSQVSIVPPGES